MATDQLPAPQPDQVFVSVSALYGGRLTLPEHLFITNADPDKRLTVPSLSFLIKHPVLSTKDGTKSSENLIFDLGLKRNLQDYALAQQHHITQRQPTVLSPDVADSLRKGGLDPAKDVDVVVLSHVHWDHVGTSSDFSSAKFVVGSGTLQVLKNGAGPLYPAELFNRDELPVDRTFELPPTDPSGIEFAGSQQTAHKWQPLANFPHVVDYFDDGSLYIIDTPGHLRGHVNLLARISRTKWVFLGGDCCHDTRILHGESGIALYDDGRGGQRSVHMDTDRARSSLNRIGELLKQADDHEIEVVIAHDRGWMEANTDRFFPGQL